MNTHKQNSNVFQLNRIEMNIGGIGVTCFDLPSSMTPYGTRAVIESGKFQFDNIKMEDGDEYVEVGAHNGLLSFYVSRLFPSSKIHIFECNPLMVKCIQMGIIANNLPNITCYPFGLSDYNGKCKFGINLENTGGSSMMIHGGHQVESEVSVYDFNVMLSVFEKIKYLKIDIEGEEFKIFNSLIKSNSNFFEKVETLNLELHDKIYPDLNLDRDGIKEYLQKFKNLNLIIQD